MNPMLSPEEKIQKYNSFNNSSGNDDGFVKYIPIDGHSPANVDFTSSNASALAKTPIAPLVNNEKDPIPAKKVDKKAADEQLRIKNDQDEWMKNFKPVYPEGTLMHTINPLSTYQPSKHTLNFNDFESEIRRKESNGLWTADGGKRVKGSTATGAYQFLWSDHGKDIMNYTSVKDRHDFMVNPTAQQSYFQHYYNTSIVPAVHRLKQKLSDKNPLSDFDLAQLIHFQGEKGATRMIENSKLADNSDPNNPSGLDYISR